MKSCRHEVICLIWGSRVVDLQSSMDRWAMLSEEWLSEDDCWQFDGLFEQLFIKY